MTVVLEDTCELLSRIGLQLMLTVWNVKKGCESFFWLFYHPLLWLGLLRWLSGHVCCDVFLAESLDQENPGLLEAEIIGWLKGSITPTSA